MEFAAAKPNSVDYCPSQMQSLWLEATSVHAKEGQFFQDTVESCLLKNLTKAMNDFQEKTGLVSKQNGHSNFH